LPARLTARKKDQETIGIGRIQNAHDISLLISNYNHIIEEKIVTTFPWKEVGVRLLNSIMIKSRVKSARVFFYFIAIFFTSQKVAYQTGRPLVLVVPPRIHQHNVLMRKMICFFA